MHVTMKVVVLCSGGMDSVTALHWARQEHAVVAAISFDYGSKHNPRELPCAAEQAALLGQISQRQHARTALVEATPESLSSAVPAGATRSLAITVTNVSDGDVTCTAGVAAGGSAGAGITVRPEQFTLAKGGKKTVEVRVEPAAGAAATDRLWALVNVEAAQDGGGHTVLSIPVDIQQKMER